MIHLISLSLLLLSLNLWATPKVELRPGDVILQPLNCWMCSLIELEEESKFSHMGVVLAVTPEILVGESSGVVKKLKLADFLSKTEVGQKALVIRFRNENLVNHLEQTSADFLKMFEEEFEGAEYDHDFLWHNYDQNGREKFYCSEMITKLFQYYVHVEPPMKRMQFKKYWDHWVTYFKGNVPVNQWGNSPADYERSSLFYHVGEL